VGTDKSAYIAGQKVYMSARVLKGSVAVAGATVSFVAVKPNSVNKVTLSGTTDSNGYARVTLSTSKSPSPIGTYQLTASAVSGGQTATAKTSFSVSK
jgi:uncharacterized protein YfaS (alpha-2-macroglobulin family)